MVREANKGDSLYAAALDFVNGQRKSLGLRATSRLPKGYPYCASLCVIAKALEPCGVRNTCYTDEGFVLLEGWRSDGTVATRQYDAAPVADFMRAFDKGEYPSLIIPPTPIKVKKPGERKMTVIG